MSEPSTIRIENHTVTTRDDTLIHATLYRPNEPNNKALVMAGAMGVKQHFYRHFAQYLAEQGFVVLSFDYRGLGESRKGSLWGNPTELWQWGAQDLQAVLAWMTRQYPAHGLGVVGHSIGAQLVGLAAYADHVEVLLSVATQNGYWNLWPVLRRLPLWVFWNAALPISTYASGYFPARLFGMGEALPKGVALAWAQIARSRNGMLDVYGGTEHNHWADFTGALLALSIQDDRWFAPRRAVDAFMSYYPNARPARREHIVPKDVGMEKIGHFGFFQPRAKEALWSASARWLLNPTAEATGVDVHATSRA